MQFPTASWPAPLVKYVSFSKTTTLKLKDLHEIIQTACVGKDVKLWNKIFSCET
jgi:hypothetical protein